MATNNKGKIIGVGRLHFVNIKESQIRYMAVDKNFRKKGVGNAIEMKVEENEQNNILPKTENLQNENENAHTSIEPEFHRGEKL